MENLLKSIIGNDRCDFLRLLAHLITDAFNAGVVGSLAMGRNVTVATSTNVDSSGLLNQLQDAIKARDALEDILPVTDASVREGLYPTWTESLTRRTYQPLLGAALRSEAAA